MSSPWLATGSDRIEIRGIRAWGRHGANIGEQDIPQRFDLDVTLHVEIGPARQSDELADTIDYAALHARIVEIVTTRRYALIERLGQEILTELLADPRVSAAEVRIAKPGILAGATPAVLITGRRYRPSP